MPYIKDPEIRDGLLGGIIRPHDAGELNFVLTSLCHEYLKYKGVNYKSINEVIGVLDCTKMELYRMIAAPYEDKKRLENGAVSELDALSLEDIR